MAAITMLNKVGLIKAMRNSKHVTCVRESTNKRSSLIRATQHRTAVTSDSSFPAAETSGFSFPAADRFVWCCIWLLLTMIPIAYKHILTGDRHILLGTISYARKILQEPKSVFGGRGSHFGSVIIKLLLVASCVGLSQADDEDKSKIHWRCGDNPGNYYVCVQGASGEWAFMSCRSMCKLNEDFDFTPDCWKHCPVYAQEEIADIRKKELGKEDLSSRLAAGAANKSHNVMPTTISSERTVSSEVYWGTIALCVPLVVLLIVSVICNVLQYKGKLKLICCGKFKCSSSGLEQRKSLEDHNDDGPMEETGSSRTHLALPFLQNDIPA